jgi:phage terminase small subunit
MPTRTKRLAFEGLPPSPAPFHFYSLLTVRERRFVDAYVATLDIGKASRSAGFLKTEHGNALLDDKRVLCAIRERQEASSEMALDSAADLRRDLRLICDADPAELSGVHKVACRHCHGVNGQYHYTAAELYYLEQAHSYGEEGWPFACVTDEFGRELHAHARAAWLAGRQSRPINLKGNLKDGDAYSRNLEINPDCPQCHGEGTPMLYVCDTRYLSDAGRKIFRGVRLANGERIEIVAINPEHAMTIRARDLRVGVERKELVVRMPRTREEMEAALQSMTTAEMEAFVQQVVTLGEGEYSEVQEVLASNPQRHRGGFRRGN